MLNFSTIMNEPVDGCVRKERINKYIPKSQCTEMAGEKLESSRVPYSISQKEPSADRSTATT